MKSPEYIAHGTSSEKDAQGIQTEGFDAQEGRATVSADLLYAFKWATKQERRNASKSHSEVEEEETGRMMIMEVPDDATVDYAAHTSIDVDNESQEISGYSSKYESGRRQLAIYNEGDVNDKRESIEAAKQELKQIHAQYNEFLEQNGIEPHQAQTKADLVEAIREFDIERQTVILQKAEELEAIRIEKGKLAEPNARIAKEHVLMSVVPTKELWGTLEGLQNKIRNVEKIDLEEFTGEITKIIQDNKENQLGSGVNVREVIGNLLRTTIEAEVMKMVRAFSMDVKRANGYQIYNRGKDEVKEKVVDKQQLTQKLEKIISHIESKDFDIGLEHVNRYLRLNVPKLLTELNKGA
ncbi:MAG: hypothetical protein WC289_01095 [Patescibacteria group bacterium]|jgi:hypothetical protein